MNDMASAVTANGGLVDVAGAIKIFSQASSASADGLSTDELSQLLRCCGIPSLVEGGPQTPELSLAVEICSTREFGMVIRAGLAGAEQHVDRYFAKDQASISAATALTDGHEFFQNFSRSFCYQQLKGAVDDRQLLNCFSAFITLANQFSPANPESSHVIESLEITSFTCRETVLSALEGSCQFRQTVAAPCPRPIAKIGKLLHPESIGIIGVSATNLNFGRIILKNLLGSGYPAEQMCIVRPGEGQIDGVVCVDNLSALTSKLDLLIVAIAADAVFDLVDQIIALDVADAVMLIPGGLGETESSRSAAEAMKQRINAAHLQENGGPVFLGGNCLGVVSHPGNYDSWFIPRERLPKPQKKNPRHCALISQSGAFMVTRLSKNPWLDPAYMTALGNQTDLSHGDMLSYFVDQEGIDTVGVYIEGFTDLDGLAFAAAVRRAQRNGKHVIVYKAGRTEAGQASALGHTASKAGDYLLCESILTQAGAMVANDLTEFDDLLYIASCLHDKTIGGRRVAGVSGAGFETVGMADSIAVGGFSLEMAKIEPQTQQRLESILIAKRLDALMEVRNPIDINPGADDEAHLLCTQAFADADNVDAVLVGLDPLSPMMRTLVRCSRPGFDLHDDNSIVQLLPQLVAVQQKPIIAIVDGGSLYNPMAEKLMDQGVCVFRSCERAMQALAKYTRARMPVRVD